MGQVAASLSVTPLATLTPAMMQSDRDSNSHSRSNVQRFTRWGILGSIGNLGCKEAHHEKAFNLLRFFGVYLGGFHTQ